MKKGTRIASETKSISDLSHSSSIPSFHYSHPRQRQPMIDKALFFLYHALWTLFALPLFPLAHWRRDIAARLRPDLPASGPRKGAVWVHALSVGEVISAIPLVKRIREESPQRPLVLTASTSQGLDIARKELRGKVDCLLRMPLDFWWSLQRVIRFIDPSLLIVVETDLWPGYLRLVKERGVPVLLVNSRISPRTFGAYRKFRPLVRRMLFSSIARTLVQSGVDRARLLEIGVDSTGVAEIGNIKFDREWRSLSREEKGRLTTSLGLPLGEEIWVAGSTHPGEDAIVLDVFLRLRRSYPRLRLVIAPRRIEEGAAVRGLALAKGLRAVLRTDRTGIADPFDVLVIDTLGELGSIYGLGRVAFVGGSLTPVGGHNLLEPASQGCPVLFGPHMHNFIAMSELLLEAGGGERVEDREGLYKAVEGLLSDPQKTDQMGNRARFFVEKNRGALNRVLEEVKNSLAL
jgi:3-deoxy-D-manno-octulosonic-acid transferase